VTHTTNSTLVLGIVVVISSLALVHIARRYPALVRMGSAAREVTPFTRIQKTMHWVIGAGSAILFFTGLPVYLAQFLVIPSVPTPLNFYYWGFQVLVWRTFHIYLALAITVVVVAHALWDTFRMGAFGRMAIGRADLKEAGEKARSFFFLFIGLPDDKRPVETSRYDPFQKVFHWSLLVLGAFLLVSGLLMWEALKWNSVPLFVVLDRWNGAFMDGFMRTGHLVAAMLFAGLVVLHTYFALLPQNRPLLRSITIKKRENSRAVAAVAVGAVAVVPVHEGEESDSRAPSKTRMLPTENSIAIVGFLGAILFAALAVIARTPAYILAPQRYEPTYYWPYSTFTPYLNFLLAELAISGVLCAATCVGWAFFARPRALRPGQGAFLGGGLYVLLGLSLAAFVSSTYFAIAPASTAVGFGAAIVGALFSWFLLRYDRRARHPLPSVA
jgi:cytochrome b subunit of formate dehydrogenase